MTLSSIILICISMIYDTKFFIEVCIGHFSLISFICYSFKMIYEEHLGNLLAWLSQFLWAHRVFFILFSVYF